MKLKVYADRLSSLSRAVLLFCKINGIDFDEIRVDLSKLGNLSPQYKAINPMGLLPAIVHGSFELFESRAVLVYLASAFPGVADHWYPADIYERAKIDSFLDWFQCNLHPGAVALFFNTVALPMLGRPSNLQAAAQGKIYLIKALDQLESIWLQGSSQFLLGRSRPSISDIVVVCELMQLELVHEKYHDKLLSPRKKILKWIEDTKNATNPHFDEIHAILYKSKKRFREWSARKARSNI